MPGRVLLSDPQDERREHLARTLREAHFHVSEMVLTANPAEIIAAESPDLIVLAEEPCVPEVKYPVCSAIKSEIASAHLPVILLVEQAVGTRRVAAFAAGADDVLELDLDRRLLIERSKSLVRMKSVIEEMNSSRVDLDRTAIWGLPHFDPLPEARKPNILMIGENAAPLDEIRADLIRCLTAEVECCDSLIPMTEDAAGVPVVRPSAYDAAVVFARGAGRPLASELRLLAEDQDCCALPAVVVLESGQTVGAAGMELFRRLDVLHWPFDIAALTNLLSTQLHRKIVTENLHERLTQFSIHSQTDKLTGLLNERHVTRSLPTRIRRMLDEGRRPGALLLNLDRFRPVNEMWGYVAGDVVLRDFAERLREAAEITDLVARFGNQNFLILHPSDNEAETEAYAERLRRTLVAERFLLPARISVGLTVSIGLAFHRDGEEPRHLLDRARAALLRAKDAGRNRVTRAAA